MKRKLLTFLLAIVTSIGLPHAESVKIGDLYYDLNETTLTAEVCNGNVQEVQDGAIDVNDGSLADWEALPSEYVFSWECSEDASMLGLKSVSVYANETYINILVEPNMDDITDLEWVPFHVYIDADNSDATGGYGDIFTDANSDICCETALFSEGQPYNYNPAVFKWWGEVGGNGWSWTDPSIEHDYDDFGGAIIGEGQLPVGNSEYVDGKFEIQLLRELLATVHPMSDTEFGIGFDIQQNWSAVGILPIGSDTEENPGGKVAKLKVQIHSTGSASSTDLNNDLSNIVIPSTVSYEGKTYRVTSIGNVAFKYYSSLTSVTIGDNVTSIGSSAFIGCSNLTSVTIGESVTSIGDRVFDGCSNLSSITVKSNTPATITDDTFLGIDCYKITLHVPLGSASAYRYASYWDEFIIDESADGSGQCGENLYSTLTDSVLTITGTGDMYGMDENSYKWPWRNKPVTSVSLPEGLTGIGNGAFEGCSIKALTIPSTVTRIGHRAFQNCEELTSIIIPDGITKIGNYAFSGCRSMTHLHIPASAEEIGVASLYGCTELTSLISPAAIFELDERREVPASYILPQYEGYIPSKLDTVIVNRGEMDEYAYGAIAFCNKTVLHMDISKVQNTELPDEAFDHFYTMRKIVLPEGLQRINYMSLANCKSLESITLPASVKEIGMSAFENCHLLEEVVFEENSSLTTIGNGAFYSCHELQHITLPEGVTEIGKLAFYACTYLNEVELPASVQALGDNAFAQCSRMEKMHVKAIVPPAIESKTFDQVSRLMPIYVPDGSVTAYKADTYWGVMNIRSEDEPPTVSVFGKEVEIIDPSDSTIVTEVDVFGDSTLVYNTTDNTLTFNGLTLEAGDSITAAISYVGSTPLTIVLTDSSSIIADTVISAMADIIIRGEGYLSAEGMVPIVGAETATITFDSVNMYVRSLSSPASVRRRIRGLKELDENGGPALSGFGSTDFKKCEVTPPDAEYGVIQVQNDGSSILTINALYVHNNVGEKVAVTEFSLTALADSLNAVSNTTLSGEVSKILIDGQLFILRDGKTYTIQGLQVR